MNKKSTTASGAATTTVVPNSYPIRAVERVCDILDLLQRSREGVSLPDVAAVTWTSMSFGSQAQTLKL